jgi:hypothetical protein
VVYSRGRKRVCENRRRREKEGRKEEEDLSNAEGMEIELIFNKVSEMFLHGIKFL